MMKVVLLVLLVFSISCSKKKEIVEPTYNAEEFMALAHETGPSNEKGEDAMKLSDYSPGVNRIDSRALKYKRLTFYAIEFETVDQARKEALRLNQYFARNWLLDRVEGEPVLEDYVIETFKAANPRRHVQRVPKKEEHPSALHGANHGENHGEAHGETHH